MWKNNHFEEFNAKGDKKENSVLKMVIGVKWGLDCISFRTVRGFTLETYTELGPIYHARRADKGSENDGGE